MKLSVLTNSLLPVALMTGCSHYQAKPLDPAGHMAAWQARDPANDDARAFAERLAQGGRSTGIYDPTDGLSLPEAEVVALVFNPDLRLQRSRAAVAAVSAEFAGQWDDPVFSLDLLKIVESVPEPWLLGTSLGFTVPLSGRLGVETARARVEEQAALFQVAELEWQVVADLRGVWVEWSSVRLQSEVLGELVERLRGIADVTDRLERAGELPRLESRLFKIEAVTRASDAQSLAARASDLELRIRSMMGLRPEAELELQPLIASDEAEEVDETALTQRNPALLRARSEYELAERNLELEVRKQYPDLVIGPAYENEDDQSHVGFAGSLPIPLWNRNRGGIAQAEAERETARLAYEAKHESLVHQLARADREHQLLRQLRAELESTLIPLVEDQVRDAQRMMELGELNSLIQLESVVGRAEAKLKLIEAREREAQAANRIQLFIGPASPETVSEIGGQP